MNWIIKIMRVLTLLVLVGGLYWVTMIVCNMGMQVLYFEPDLQFVSTMTVILVIMPLLVVFSTTNKFIVKWWNNKGRIILLILYLLTVLGYLASVYWGLAIAAS